MKKTLLSVICAITIGAFQVKAQTKIYDFPFDGSYDAIVGAGTFNGNSGISMVTHLNGALSTNNANGITASLNNLPIGNNSRTISLWFNRQGGGNTGMFSYGISGQEFGISFDGSGGLVFAHDGINTSLAIPGVSYNNWHHLAITHNGSEVKIYFNGTLTNTIQTTLNTSNSNFKLGNVIGYFDELRIYNYALSATEVQSDYLYTPPTDPCNLISLYTFNNTAFDYTGKNPFSNEAFDVGKKYQGLLVLNSTKTATISNVPSGNSARTVSMWLFRGTGTTVSTFPGIFYYGGLNNQSGSRFGLYYNSDGSFVFQGYGSGYDHAVLNTSSTAAQWRHIAIAYDGSNVSFYQNGTLSDTWAVSLNTSTDGKFILGGTGLYGVYDDLRIYDRALDATEIQNIFTNIELHSCNLTTNIAGVNLEKNQFEIYPNPASTYFQLNNIIKGSMISVIDITGKFVYRKIANESKVLIETENLTNGIYIIEVENNGVKSRKKLILSGQ